MTPDAERGPTKLRARCYDRGELGTNESGSRLEAQVEDQTARRAAIIEEAQRIEDLAGAWTAAQRRQAAGWRRWNTLLTVSAAVLATLAGATGLATPAYRVVAGVAALCAAALSATATGIGASARSAGYFRAASVNQQLAARCSAFRTTVAPYVPIEEAVRGLAALCEQRDKAILDAPLEVGMRTLNRFGREGLRPEGRGGRERTST